MRSRSMHFISFERTRCAHPPWCRPSDECCAVQVSKPVPLVAEFERLCNDLLPGSFDLSARMAAFAELNKLRHHFIGIVGEANDVWQELCSQGAACSIGLVLCAEYKERSETSLLRCVVCVPASCSGTEQPALTSAKHRLQHRKMFAPCLFVSVPAQL
jgi:hypothetical protein